MIHDTHDTDGTLGVQRRREFTRLFYIWHTYFIPGSYGSVTFNINKAILHILYQICFAT